jgi:hypothetical protein
MARIDPIRDMPNLMPRERKIRGIEQRKCLTEMSHQWASRVQGIVFSENGGGRSGVRTGLSNEIPCYQGKL